jgi:hypothetical protein
MEPTESLHGILAVIARGQSLNLVSSNVASWNDKSNCCQMDVSICITTTEVIEISGDRCALTHKSCKEKAPRQGGLTAGLRVRARGLTGAR